MMKKKKNPISIILIGGGSLQIQEILDRFEERSLNIHRLKLFDESERCGEIHDYKGEPIIVGRLNDIPESDYDVAVLLSPVKNLQKLTTVLVEGNIPLLDLSGSFSASDQIPVIFPEFWKRKPRRLPAISILPNPLGIILGLISKPIHEHFGLNYIKMFVLQGASQVGSKRGMDELFDQTRAILGFKDPTVESFPQQLAFNTFPVEGRDTYSKTLRNHIKVLLNNSDLDLDVDVSWGGFFVGMAGSLWFNTQREMDEKKVVDLISKSKSLRVVSNGKDPSILDIVGRDHILISGIRVEKDKPFNLTLRFVMDNLRKGLSTNLVQVLEIFF